jgi:hypothetical protein
MLQYIIFVQIEAIAMCIESSFMILDKGTESINWKKNSFFSKW